MALRCTCDYELSLVNYWQNAYSLAKSDLFIPNLASATQPAAPSAMDPA